MNFLKTAEKRIPHESTSRKVKSGSWKDREYRVMFINKIAQAKNIVNPEDWNKVSSSFIKKNGGSGLLRMFSNSLLDILKDCYPQYNWDNLKEQFKPIDWDSSTDQRKFLDRLGSKLGLLTPKDWLKVHRSVVIRNGGSRLISRYKSLTEALIHIYPEHNWDTMDFKTKPHRWWQSIENQKKALDEISKRLGIKSKEDWYNKTILQIAQEGGRSLLKLYKNSIWRMLTNLQPEENWDIWKLNRLPRNSKNVSISDASLKAMMNRVEKKLGIKETQDWYRISTNQLKTIRGATHLIKTNGGLQKVLQKCYPNFEWNEEILNDARMKRSSQWMLLQVVRQIFPDTEIKEEYSHPKIVNQEKLQLDIYLPQYSLAFEYQGEFHYQSSNKFGTYEMYKRVDEIKRVNCKSENITLIEVPYWWDKSKESLLATISSHRPDLITYNGEISFAVVY